MDFQAVKGTRDFYPDQMALRNWMTQAWRKVSLRNGFVEFDGPVMEYLDLFRVKSGDEIVSQLFSFTDRGGRQLALRPEITPTLARMVNARIQSLPRPIKWFAIPRLFRAENPQKGRLREFLQWNVDIIGDDGVLADAECIFTAVDLLAELKLTPKEAVVRIGSRPLTVAVLRAAGVEDANMDSALAALDKRQRISAAEFTNLAEAAGIPAAGLDSIKRFQDAPDLAAVAAAVGESDEHIADLQRLMGHLEQMGVADYCRLDMGIVRGLAYYTGVVYEVHDAAGSLRAVAGGGRYDDLLKVLGGPEVAATGFGMGDAVLAILLAEKGKLPDLTARLDCFVVPGGDGLADQVLKIVAELRRKNVSADYSLKSRSLSKLLKEANRRNADRAVIVREDGLAVKDLRTGDQRDVPVEQFLSDPAREIGGGGHGQTQPTL